MNILSADNRAFGFTLQSSHYHSSQISWFELSYNYVSITSTCTVLIECSSDNSTWYTLHSSSIEGSQRTYYLPNKGLPSNQKYIRFTFTKITNLTTGRALNCIKRLTSRKGNQGLGRENELPMRWTANGTLYPIRANSELGTTSSKMGKYTRFNIYRGWIIIIFQVRRYCSDLIM